MRITHEEIKRIIQALSGFVGKHHAELRLYGSRVHDSLKGGDIDLLLLIEDSCVAEQLTEKKHYLLSSIKSLLGDQKIDLTVAIKTAVKQDPFLQMILPASVCLHKWNYQVTKKEA